MVEFFRDFIESEGFVVELEGRVAPFPVARRPPWTAGSLLPLSGRPACWREGNGCTGASFHAAAGCEHHSGSRLHAVHGRAGLGAFWLGDGGAVFDVVGRVEEEFVAGG